jgi:hypothetical protein
MRFHVRRRFWVELACAAASAVLLLLTLVWKDWIEIVTGTDPDHDSGSLEWVVVAVAFVVTIVLLVTARIEWRRRPTGAVAGDVGV